MWIEYCFNLEGKNTFQGVINFDDVKFIEWSPDAEGKAFAIELYFKTAGTFTLFLDENREIMEDVWHALKNAIAGYDNILENIGYIRPIDSEINCYAPEY